MSIAAVVVGAMLIEALESSAEYHSEADTASSAELADA